MVDDGFGVCERETLLECCVVEEVGVQGGVEVEGEEVMVPAVVLNQPGPARELGGARGEGGLWGEEGWVGCVVGWEGEGDGIGRGCCHRWELRRAVERELAGFDV